MVTIYRRAIAGRLVYMIWDSGRYIEVSERLVLAHQRRGQCKIKTLETA